MDFEIIDEIHSNIVDMDDEYEILHQEIQSHSILSQTSSQSSILVILNSILSSYQLIFILLLSLILLYYVVNYILQSNNYKQLKETLSSSLNDELIKLEKEVDGDSLSNTFIIRLQIIANHIINETKNNSRDNKRDIIKYSDYLSRIDKILQTLVLPRIRLSIPSFLNYIKVVVMTNTLIELDKYIVRFNIVPLLENKSFKTDLDNARDIYEKLKYTNSSETLKLSSIEALKSACECDNADVIREALAFAKAYNFDKDYSYEYNSAEITLQNLETIEKKAVITEKQRRLNEHINVLNFGANKIKNELIESGNNLISGMIKHNDIMLIETETIASSTDKISKIINNNNDHDDDSDIILLEGTLIKKSTSFSEQLVLFSNENCNAMVPISNRKNALVLVDQTGDIVSDPDVKQQFALTVHKTETDIINLNKETGLEIAKAVKEYNQTVDDHDRHMEEEWKKCREAARIRVEMKISNAILDDNKFSLALQQNKRLSEKLDMCTSNSDENMYICHQNWKNVQQKWDAIFFITTLIISFCVFIKTSSNRSVFIWLYSLFNSLCHEITSDDQTITGYKTVSQQSHGKASGFCEGNSCSYDDSTVWVWWNLDPFRPISYILGIAMYNAIIFLAYFKLDLASLNALRCCLNIVTRIMTPLLLSFVTYKYANLFQLAKYILVIGIGLCLCAPITRFFWPFRNFSYLLLGHTIFHFVILGMDWHLTWAVSLSNKVFDMRWIAIYIIYPFSITVLSAYLGCLHYSHKDNQVLHNDLFTLTECVNFRLLGI